MSSCRIIYLDLTKLLTIYLVILGHVLVVLDRTLLVGGELYRFIYTFHMPLFMLLSGYFADSSFRKPFGKFAMGKVRQLLLPAVTCTVLCCSYLYAFRGVHDFRIELIGNSWFLKTLLCYFLITWPVLKFWNKDWQVALLSCILLFVVPHAYSLQLNLLYPYFWGGYLVRKYSLLELIVGSKRCIAGLVLLFILLYGVQSWWDIPVYIPVTVDSLIQQWNLILFRYMALRAVWQLSRLWHSFAGNMMVKLGCQGLHAMDSGHLVSMSFRQFW